MGRVDDYLFDRSQTGNDDLGLTALRDLRRVRGQLAQRFEQAVIIGFRNLRDPRGGNTVLGGHAGLSLLSEDALEEQLANEQLAESLARMHAPSLELLDKRFAFKMCIRDRVIPVVEATAAVLGAALSPDA